MTLSIQTKKKDFFKKKKEHFSTKRPILRRLVFLEVLILGGPDTLLNHHKVKDFIHENYFLKDYISRKSMIVKTHLETSGAILEKKGRFRF